MLSTWHSNAQGQENDTTDIAYVNEYYEVVHDLVSIKLDLNSNNERFDLNTGAVEFDIRPNTALKTRLSFNYAFLSFHISYLPKFLPGNNDDDLKGRTKGGGFGFGFRLEHWVQELDYNKVRGFYLENSEDFIPDWIQNTTPYIQFPDLKVTSFRGSTSYKLNPNLSLPAISTQTEIQLKSAGSFMPGLVYSFYHIDNKSNSSSQTTSQRSSTLEAILTLGYIHTFVLKKGWYAAIGLAPGFGVNYTDLLTRYPEENVSTDYYNAVFRINGRGALGYNSKRFLGGGEIIAYRSFRDENSTTVTLATTRIAFQVFIGYRILAPMPLQKMLAKMEGQMDAGKAKWDSMKHHK